MTNLVRSNFQAHPFHLVSPSPWPVFTSICLLALTTSGVLTMHAFSFVQDFLYIDFLYIALLLGILTMSFCYGKIKSHNFTPNKKNLIAIVSNYNDVIEKTQKLLIRAFNSLDWGLNNPPKPHAFVSLPSQSNLFNIIKRNHLFVLSINHARFFSRHPVLYWDKDAQASFERHLAKSDERWDSRDKLMQAFKKDFDMLTKEEAIDKWKKEDHALKEDCRRLDEQHKAIGVAEDHPIARDDSSRIQTRAQALEEAANTCKHKLTDRDAALELPDWRRERDEYLQNVQDSQPMDFIDPDC